MSTTHQPTPGSPDPHAPRTAASGGAGFSFGTFLVGVIVGLVVGLFAGVVVMPLIDQRAGRGPDGAIINSSAPRVQGGSELKPGEKPAEMPPPSDEELARARAAAEAAAKAAEGKAPPAPPSAPPGAPK